MFPLLQIQSIPIEELWRESYIAMGEIEVPLGNITVTDPYRDIANFFIILGLVAFLVVAHRRIMVGLACTFSAVISTKKLIAIESQSNLQTCRNTLFLFLTLCTSFVFANIAYATKIIGYNYTLPLKFAGIFLFIMLFFALRSMALQFLSWININSVFKLAGKIAYTYCCLWNITVLCCFFVIKSIPPAPMGTMRLCIIFSTLSIFIPYFLALYKIFMQKGISHFFYILYLCTLEILPVAVLLHLNFN